MSVSGVTNRTSLGVTPPIRFIRGQVSSHYEQRGGHPWMDFPVVANSPVSKNNRRPDFAVGHIGSR